MVVRCGRCGANSAAAAEFCRRCGQSLVAATPAAASGGTLERSLSVVAGAVPPTVWRGVAALAAGTLVEVLRRALARRLAPGGLSLNGDGIAGIGQRAAERSSPSGDFEVTEVVIYRRFVRRR